MVFRAARLQAPRARGIPPQLILVASFPEGAAITTEDNIYFDLGFEGISGSANRAAVDGQSAGLPVEWPVTRQADYQA